MKEKKDVEVKCGCREDVQKTGGTMIDKVEHGYLEGIPDGYALHDYSKGSRPIGTMSCGSHRFNDAPKVLYRLIYYFGEGVKLPGNMYKSGTWMHICSPCYKFAISVEFHKYELCAYFSCSKDNHSGKVNSITCGAPGHDNGSKCVSSHGQKWFEEFIRIIESEHWIYPGNNFIV